MPTNEAVLIGGTVAKINADLAGFAAAQRRDPRLSLAGAAYCANLE